jgi:hypothetical protein
MSEQWIPEIDDEVVAAVDITEGMLAKDASLQDIIRIPEGTHGDIIDIYDDGGVLSYDVDWQLWPFEDLVEDGCKVWTIFYKDWMKLREATDDSE